LHLRFSDQHPVGLKIRNPSLLFAKLDEEMHTSHVRAGHRAAGTYQNQAAPIRSAAVWNFVLVHKDIPAGDAYLLTNTFLPFHPGALKYYHEAGVSGLK
jgi:TRAP-type uncharacterized transport system substrate-binding protein